MRTLPFLFLAFLTASAQADPPSGQPSPSSKFDSSLLGGTNPTLTQQEQAGVAVTQAWKDKSYQTLMSKPGSNASVEFQFGESLPSIVCAVLQVTDIELQAGEVVTHVNLGDSIRWMVESAISGSGSNQVSHLIVKPREKGLSTSMIVTTDRRTYHLLLVSDETEFMHDVTFLYEGTVPVPVVTTPTPSPTPAKVAKDPSPRRRQSSGKKVVEKQQKPEGDGADENYVIQGRPGWKPVSAYSKDGKTYIEMPPSVKHREAPVLFEEKRSGLFGHKKDLCNYRVHGKWYVVDRVLDTATLVNGVGSGQEKVTIRHTKPKEVNSGN